MIVENGEFIRAFANVQEQNFDVLFLMHHLAGDGKSLSYFIESFMRSLNGEELDFVPIRLLEEKDLPKESKLPFVAKMIHAYYNMKWRREKKVFSIQDLQRSYDLFWKSHKTEIIIETYDRAVISDIRNQAKKIGCHMTAYMIAKYLENYKDVRDVGLAVDGRIDGNHSMGNQATGISVKERYNRKRSFKDNAVHIQKLLQRKLV